MANKSKSKSKKVLRPRQTQSRQPGIESVMKPRPQADDPGYEGSSMLAGRVALI